MKFVFARRKVSVVRDTTLRARKSIIPTAERGLDLNSAADRQLLTSRIDSPLAAARGFGKPYPSFPGSATVAQSLRPFPQFADGLAVRWAPLGQTWYDALHLNVTQRQWHNLSLTAAFTQVQENMSVGRRFSAAGSSTFEIRAEFFNVFNRTYLVNPSSNNALATRTFNALGEPTGGFGYVNPTATPPQLPRSGQIVARFEF